jgi:hypothetical protein
MPYEKASEKDPQVLVLNSAELDNFLRKFIYAASDSL